MDAHETLLNAIDPLAYLLNFTVYTVCPPPVALSKTDMREGFPSCFPFIGTARPPHRLL